MATEKKCEATSTNHLRTKGGRLETAASGAAAGKKAQTQPFFINNRPFGLGTGQDIRILAKKKQKSQEG